MAELAQRWNWRSAERLDQIKDGQNGSGLMESVCRTPDGSHFLMAGRQAHGTWNAALCSAADGQPQRKLDKWPEWGVLQTYTLA